MRTAIFGVRHHGPGCARALVSALERFDPDYILLEGPPDGEEALKLAADPKTKPPVAMLIYPPDEPRRVAFYPFASFSPEWIAIRFANARNVPIRLIDLPLSVRFALDKRREERGANVAKTLERLAVEKRSKNESYGETNAEIAVETSLAQEIRDDPLAALARAAGRDAPETWWERAIEQSGTPGNVFPGILAAATELRTVVAAAEKAEKADANRENAENFADSERDDERNFGRDYERLREAAMRRSVREALKTNARRIAIIGGAWHSPVLDLESDDPARAALVPTKKEDEALLSRLPKIKTTATWAPWTFSRLTFRSGYGAGIESPGWFEHLWEASPEAARLNEICGVSGSRPGVFGGESNFDAISDANTETENANASATVEEKIERFSKTSPTTPAAPSPISVWTTRAARLLRRESLDVSAANVIETVRLADALAALRDRTTPGLSEARDALLSVLCAGRREPLELIRERLETGFGFGSVSPSAPVVPLERDLEREQKRLRLKRSEDSTTLDLDLRKENDRAKSRLFHRLSLLDVPWGTPQDAKKNAAGTFHELWETRWKPDFVVSLIEASAFGSTLKDASSGFALKKLDSATSLREIFDLLSAALPAEISAAALERIYERLQNDAALSSDVGATFAALPSLVGVLRYGDVRKTDVSQLEPVFNALFERILVGLPGACSALDDEAAARRLDELDAIFSALQTFGRPERLAEWLDAVEPLTRRDSIARTISGRFARILFEQSVWNDSELARTVAFSIAPPVDAKDSARWLEGFLRGSGQSLVWLDSIWSVLNRRLAAFDDETFRELLPPLRRAFSDFESPERREMGRVVAKLRLDQGTESSVRRGVRDGANLSQELPPYDVVRARRLIPTLRLVLTGERPKEGENE